MSDIYKKFVERVASCLNSQELLVSDEREHEDPDFEAAYNLLIEEANEILIS